MNIKFRGFDDSIGKMYSFEELLRTDRDGRSYYGILRILSRENYHYHLMMFTGLKDKNCKELYYDSDIVKLETGEIAIATKDGFDCPWLIVDGFPIIDFIDYFNKYSRQGFEVIGNKYENPDLIKP